MLSRNCVRNASARVKAILEWLRGLVYFALVSYPAKAKSETKPMTKPEWDVVTPERKGDPVLGRRLLERWDSHQ